MQLAASAPYRLNGRRRGRRFPSRGNATGRYFPSGSVNLADVIDGGQIVPSEEDDAATEVVATIPGGRNTVQPSHPRFASGSGWE